MKNNLFLSFFFITVFTFSQQAYKKNINLMGSSFEITVVTNSQDQGNHYINLAINEITRIEKLISSWDKNSQTSEINRNAGIKPVIVDEELFQLIQRTVKISKLTNGAFDISFASMDKIWHFDGKMKEMPSEVEIKKSIEKINYQNIILNEDNNSVFLKLENMKIGFGGIGKGYAADKAKSLLIEKGVMAGIINASGDLNTWGSQPNGKPWMVAIVNPLNNKKVFSWTPLNNNAVVTSGNYEKYVKFNNILYTHIIDPRTGYPATGILSVSIFAKTAELADALATSIFVMGKETGLDFVNQLKGVECIIVDENNSVITSKNIELNSLNND